MRTKLDEVQEVCDNPVVFSNPSWEDAIIGTTEDDRVVYDYDLMLEWYTKNISNDVDEAREAVDDALRACSGVEGSHIVMFGLMY